MQQLFAQVICIDEATSNVDPATDSAIQSVLSNCLIGRTVMTVAHRVATVLAGSDRVLVMEAGRLVEEGGPDELMADPESAFAKLVAASTGQEAN